MLKNKHNQKPKVCLECEDKVSCVSMVLAGIPLLLIILVALTIVYIIREKQK